MSYWTYPKDKYSSRIIILSKVDQLLDAHRVEEALNWAEEHSRENATPDMLDERMVSIYKEFARW